MSKKVYILENLGCANCAAKIEKKIIDLPGIDEAIITFATKQLLLTADDPDSYIEEIESIARSFEPDIRIKERKGRQRGTGIHKEEHCSCGTHHHEQEHCSCSTHHHEQASHSHKETSELAAILAGAVLFLIGLIFPKSLPHLVSLALFITSYLILGWPVLKNAAAGIQSRQIFDENFLMSIATIGAFLIGEYPEAAGVMLFFRIGEYFEHRAVETSRKAIMEAIDMRPETVNLVTGDSTTPIPAEDAVPGQILLVRAGDRIPLDGTLVEGTSRIDTSAVTGEPVPVFVSPGDSLISGCLNLSGMIKIRVDKPLEESMVSRILECVENAAAGKPQMERFITRFSRIYTPFVVITALLTAILPSILTGEWSYWIYTALTFLVISCPCALVLSVPLAFFSGIGAGSSHGILFKSGLSLEAIQNIKAVVMDKTGTITKGSFEVVEIIPLDSDYSRTELLSLFASCETASSHPIAGSILDYAKIENIPYEKPDFAEETPGQGIHARISQCELLCGNRKLMEHFHIDADSIPESSYGTEVLLAVNGKLAGLLSIEDQLKPESAQAIRMLHQLGLHTAMLTGDNEANAQIIGQKTGIQTVYSQLLPEDKLHFLQKIRKEKGAVMFVGDGMNDAPVLAGADVGAAMGNGSDAAIEAADLVFMNKDLLSVHKAIAISKASIRTAKQNIIFALIVKAFVLILGFFQYANMWFAVFADSGVAMICVLNSVRVLYRFKKRNTV